MERWIEETLHRGFRARLRADRVLFDSQTELQNLIIFETPDFGRVMMLDGVVQLSTKDEFVYHEMMSHVPLFAHGRARKALIIGGGDGGVLRESLKHPELEAVTLCEIDRGVIDLCREYFPEVSAGAYDDPRTRIVIADGTKFVAETDERFDVIMVDSTDPIGPGAVLFTREFYADCRRALAGGGVLVTQNGIPFLQAGELKHPNSSRLGAKVDRRRRAVHVIESHRDGRGNLLRIEDEQLGGTFQRPARVPAAGGGVVVPDKPVADIPRRSAAAVLR